MMHFNGEGIPQDYAEAAKWFRQAANQGDAHAQTSLGAMYVGGQVAGEERDRVALRMTLEQIAEAQKLAREWRPLNY